VLLLSLVLIHGLLREPPPPPPASGGWHRVTVKRRGPVLAALRGGREPDRRAVRGTPTAGFSPGWIHAKFRERALAAPSSTKLRRRRRSRNVKRGRRQKTDGRCGRQDSTTSGAWPALPPRDLPSRSTDVISTRRAKVSTAGFVGDLCRLEQAGFRRNRTRVGHPERPRLALKFRPGADSTVRQGDWIADPSDIRVSREVDRKRGTPAS